MAESKKDTRSNKPIKSWFITFPQSGDYTLQNLVETFSVYEVQYSKVVKEFHQDGNPHLHLVIQFKTPHTKNALLGQIKKKFPNDWKRIHIQSLGSKHMADVYLGKDPAEVLETGEYIGKVKKPKVMPQWLIEASTERKSEEVKDYHFEKLEVEYERGRRIARHMLLSRELEEVYPVWRRNLDMAHMPFDEYLRMLKK